MAPGFMSPRLEDYIRYMLSKSSFPSSLVTAGNLSIPQGWKQPLYFKSWHSCYSWHSFYNAIFNPNASFFESLPFYLLCSLLISLFYFFSPSAIA